MKIIIAGAGAVGEHLARMLRTEKHFIYLIDTREERLKELAAEIDINYYCGSTTSVETLQNVNVAKADLFISVTNSEHANINAAIMAKKMGARKCLSRIDNLEYLEEDKLDFFTQLGIDYMFYPEQLAAVEIAGLVHQSSTSDVTNFAGGKLMLYAMRMDENAPALNSTLDEFHNLSKDPEYKVVGIIRNDTTIFPQQNEKLIENDLVYTITTQKGIELLKKYFGKKTENIRNVMILGGSRVGINTAKELGRKQTIKLIEKDRTKSYTLSNALHGTLVINGDGRNIDLLQQEGIANTDAFIAVTGDSEINMIACLLAKRLGVKKTIAEIENTDYIRLAENMGIDTIINKKIVTASKIFGFTMSEEVSSVKCLTCTNAEVMEFVAKPDSKITQGTLASVGFPKDAIIGGIVRGKNAVIAEDTIEIKPFDRVIVFAMPDNIKKVSKYFTSSERFF